MKIDEFKEKKLSVQRKLEQSANELRALIVACKDDKDLMKSIRGVIYNYDQSYKQLLYEFENPDDIDLTDYR